MHGHAHAQDDQRRVLQSAYNGIKTRTASMHKACKSGCAATCATTSNMVHVLVRPFLRTCVRKVDGGLALTIAQ